MIFESLFSNLLILFIIIILIIILYYQYKLNIKNERILDLSKKYLELEHKNKLLEMNMNSMKETVEKSHGLHILKHEETNNFLANSDTILFLIGVSGLILLLLLVFRPNPHVDNSDILLKSLKENTQTLNETFGKIAEESAVHQHACYQKLYTKLADIHIDTSTLHSVSIMAQTASQQSLGESEQLVLKAATEAAMAIYK